MWATTAAGNGEIGSHVALSPTGGQVAFISHTVNRQMPMALLTLGNIEIWNVADKTGSDTKVLALDHPMSWFPDGRRLAYATLVHRSELPPDAGGLEKFGSYFGETWDELPAVFIYDLESKKSRFFHVGWSPLVSSDGKSMLVGGWKGDDYDLGARRRRDRPNRPRSIHPVGRGSSRDRRTDLTYYVGLSHQGNQAQAHGKQQPIARPQGNADDQSQRRFRQEVSDGHAPPSTRAARQALDRPSNETSAKSSSNDYLTPSAGLVA